VFQGLTKVWPHTGVRVVRSCSGVVEEGTIIEEVAGESSS